MPASTGKVGLGVTIEIGDGASPENFTPIAQVASINGPRQVLEFVDKTHLASEGGYREKQPHLKNVEQISLTLHFDPSNTNQTALRADFEARTLRNFRIQLGRAGGLTTADTDWDRRLVFSGYIASLSANFEIDNIIQNEVAIEVTGAVTLEDNA